MRIIQIIATLTYGDGVSNCLLNLIDFFSREGIDNLLFCNTPDKRLGPVPWRPIRDLESFQFSDDDIVLYHFYGSMKLNLFVEQLACRKILVYQNVAYAKLFREVMYDKYTNLLAGAEDAKQTTGCYLRAIVLSDFSERNLIEYGWKKRNISIFPLYKLTEKGKADEGVLQKYGDARTNIIFTGRISPNKKIEDIIKIYAYYKMTFDNSIRLILVGREQFEDYKKNLDEYIQDNGIRDVIFTGHVSEEELEAYYKVADLFLCMSEHEGFGIPILESMARGIPVVAYAATAVPYTMGGAGILVRTKDPAVISRKMARVLSDERYRERVIAKQLERILRENLESQRDRFLKFLWDVEGIKEWHYRRPDGFLKQENWFSEPEKALDISYLDRFGSVVIYGFGKVGRKLCTSMLQAGKGPVAVCDNSVPASDGGGIEILGHDECVKKYPDAQYIITVQRGYMNIIRLLVKDGIAFENITFFNAGKKRFEGCE